MILDGLTVISGMGPGGNENRRLDSLLLCLNKVMLDCRTIWFKASVLRKQQLPICPLLHWMEWTREELKAAEEKITHKCLGLPVYLGFSLIYARNNVVPDYRCNFMAQCNKSVYQHVPRQAVVRATCLYLTTVTNRGSAFIETVCSAMIRRVSHDYQWLPPVPGVQFRNIHARKFFRMKQRRDAHLIARTGYTGFRTYWTFRSGAGERVLQVDDTENVIATWSRIYYIYLLQLQLAFVALYCFLSHLRCCAHTRNKISRILL